MNKLDLILEPIQEKYIEWFKARPPKFNGEEHDLLKHHYYVNHDKFVFYPDSELPKNIQDECHALLKKLSGS